MFCINLVSPFSLIIKKKINDRFYTTHFAFDLLYLFLFCFVFVVCSANLHASNNKRQFFSHPSYGSEDYKSSLRCSWRLTTRSGYIIHLRFKEFDVENEKLCGCDYVAIRDGNNNTAPLLGRVCGQVSTKPTREFVSTGNRMWIKFQTDLTNNRKGFIAEYFRSRKTEKRSL